MNLYEECCVLVFGPEFGLDIYSLLLVNSNGLGMAYSAIKPSLKGHDFALNGLY
jgi:hypothetical protein